MTQTKRRSLAPEALRASAWEAFKAEIQSHTFESLERDGWKWTGSVEGVRAEAVLRRAKERGWETEKFTVFHGGKRREMNFIRPRVS
jgi:hypothetical protein